MKRLAIITSHPIQYNAPLFRLLTERGKVQVRVYYTWGEGALKNKYDPGFGKVIDWDIPLLDGYEHVFLENTSKAPGSHHYNGIDNPDIISRIREWQPDALMVYGWPFKSHLKVMRHFKKKIPVIFRGDSTLVDEAGGIKAGLKKVALKFIYRNIDYALYTGKANYAYFRRYGLRDKQLVLAAHAVDNSRFGNPQAKKLVDFRKQLGIPVTDFVFLFAGKLELKKDPETLIRAFMQLEQPGTHLVLSGNGPLENQIIKNYKSIRGIHFLPFQNQQSMPALYDMADAFVLPSRGPNETWGLAVNEALASGVPVIVSDKCGCAPDLVVEGRNGCVFRAGDTAELAQKMIAVKKAGRAAMAPFCLQYIDKFSLDRLAGEIESLLDRMPAGEKIRNSQISC